SFTSCGCVGSNCQTRTTYKNFSVQESNGTNHRADKNFTLSSSPAVCGGEHATGSAYVMDNSGYKFVVTDGLVAVYAPDGTSVANQGTPNVSVQDTNGNFAHYLTGSIVDTLGRIPVTTSTSGNQVFVDYLNPQGSTSRVTLTTITLSL